MNQMTSSQALDILAQATAQYKGTLEEHNTIQQALKVIDDALKGSVEDKGEPDK